MVDADEIDIDDYAGQVVLYLLSQQCKNSTVKKPELIKAVLPDLGRKNIKAIFDEAKNSLKKIHGANLIELEESTKQLMLVNAVPTDPPLNWSDEIRKQQAILLPVLSLIFMSGGSAPENDVKTLLRKLRIINDNELSYDSEEFGDVEKILKNVFVSQRYLNYGTTKPQNAAEGDVPISVFTWGIRSELEISKEKILKFVSDVYGVDVTNWPDQLARLNR